MGASSADIVTVGSIVPTGYLLGPGGQLDSLSIVRESFFYSAVEESYKHGQ